MTLAGVVPSTPLLLAYSLPLLLVSALLTLAGAFLILDRTASFPPSYDVVPGAFEPKKRRFYSLQGGVGGLAVGFVFGVHLSTFLSLLIPAVTPSAAHTPASFISVWILSALLTTAIGGRWKYGALAFAGISGGALIALSLAVIVHPSLITRVVLGSIFTPIFACATLVPHDRFQHASLRVATSATGAFGVILAIALLAHVSAWANVWERWWLPHNTEWGSEKGRGLSAALFMIFIIGLVCDWFLHWKFGTCPDQKWDHYLSTYAVNLPDRAGTFKPLESVWGRLFRRTSSFPSNDALLPSIKNLRPPISTNQGQLHSKPKFHVPFAEKRGSVKFKSFDDLESTCSSDSEDAVRDTKARSFVTLAGPEVEPKSSLNFADSDKAITSDSQHIQTVASHMNVPASTSTSTSPDRNDNVRAKSEHVEKQRQNPPATHEYNYRSSRRYRRHPADNVASAGFALATTSPRRQPSPPSTSSPLGAVQATSSLIKALDRVASAQQDAFRNRAASKTDNFASLDIGPLGTDDVGGSPQLKKRFDGFEWDDFWKDIEGRVRHETFYNYPAFQTNGIKNYRFRRFLARPSSTSDCSLFF